jgi:hypothetical protein
MILTEQCLKLIETKMGAIAYSYYEALPPEPVVYPFIVSQFISNPLTFGFTYDYEKIRIQFSVFDNSPNNKRTIQIMNELELLWDKQSYTFIDSDGGIRLNCIQRADERIPYLNEDHYWQGSIDFIFYAQRLSGKNDAESSSSSSYEENWSSSSESSYSGSYSSSSTSSSSNSSSETESETSTSSRSSSSTSSES